MAFGYRKRKKIGPGLFVNFSKSGVGVGAGRRGASVSRSARGRKQLSLGWKGFFWRKRI
jgi:hypothetical protein